MKKVQELECKVDIKKCRSECKLELECYKGQKNKQQTWKLKQIIQIAKKEDTIIDFIKGVQSHHLNLYFSNTALHYPNYELYAYVFCWFFTFFIFQ